VEFIKAKKPCLLRNGGGDEPDRILLTGFTHLGFLPQRVDALVTKRIIAAHVSQRDDNPIEMNLCRFSRLGHAIASRRSVSEIGSDPARHAG